MKNSIMGRRGSQLARWTSAVLLALGASSCIAGSYGWYETPQDAGPPPPADLSVEIEALASELSQRAELRIPLGTARVVIDDPVPIRPQSARFRPAQYGARERAAAQAALRFELEMALGNRMNVVGARDLSTVAVEASSAADSTLAMRAQRTRATHALLGSFVCDGELLDVSVQLVELESEWIVATARRRIVNFVPDAYDEMYGVPAPVEAPVEDRSRTAEAGAVPVTDETLTASLADEEPVALQEPEAAGAEEEFVSAVVDPALENDEPIEFTEGPAAVRLRALENRAPLQPGEKTGEN